MVLGGTWAEAHLGECFSPDLKAPFPGLEVRGFHKREGLAARLLVAASIYVETGLPKITMMERGPPEIGSLFFGLSYT
jgi:hypothetical protein